MTVTRKEMKDFEKTVCDWLYKHGVLVKYMNIKGDYGFNGYVLCWNRYTKDYTIITRENWINSLRNSYSKVKTGE